MKYEGWDYLDHMVQTCEELSVCLEGINSPDELKQSIVKRRVVTMCLLDLGELFKSLGEYELNECPSQSWKDIIGFRNRSAHGYRNLDFKIVYGIATELVSPLYKFLKNKQQELEYDIDQP